MNSTSNAQWSDAKPATPDWYNASMERDADCRRYWDGEKWSVPVYADSPVAQFERAKATPGDPGDRIEWRPIAACLALACAVCFLSGMPPANEVLADCAIRMAVSLS